MNNYSFALFVTACDHIITYTGIGFVASMVANYMLLCAFVWEVVVPIGC